MLKRVTKSTTLLGLGTFSSRILGFVRDVLIAKYFGTSAVLEAFIVAFRIPNLLRSLFGEGFSDSVATPVLAEYYQDKRKFFELGNQLLVIFFVLLSVFTVAGMILSPYLAIVLAPGFAADPAKFDLTVAFIRITFCYLLLIGLVSVLESLLYAAKRFFAPAFSPCFLNISFIIAILFFRLYFENLTLVIAVIAAGVSQLLFSYYFIRRQGFRFRIPAHSPLREKVILRMFRLFVPRVWSAVVYHLNVLVDTIFSSFAWIVGQGALAAIYYANRIIQFPLALIALSVARVALVDFSRMHMQGNMEDFKKLFVFSFQNITFFIVPISIVFLFIPQAIINVLFFRGRFDAASLVLTSSVFFFYSFGLFFFCAIKLMVNAFYALKDTLTPAKVASLSLVVNAVLNAVFMFPLKAGGLALASSIAAGCNFFFLYHILAKRVGGFPWSSIYRETIKLVVIGIILGLVARQIVACSFANKYILLVIALGVDLLLFCVAGVLLHVRQFIEVRRWIQTSRKK